MGSLADRIVEDRLKAMREVPCPTCGGPGPIDCFTRHWIWSAVVITNRGRTSSVACWPCARKAYWESILQAMLFGWWGIPHGVLFTPIQIGRNVMGLLHPHDPENPTRALRELVRVNVMAGGKDSELPTCPACETAYDPDDYRPDAESMRCRRCNRELRASSFSSSEGAPAAARITTAPSGIASAKA
jgi:hypothetical protein